MKMQLAAVALILGSSFVQANDVKFVNADGSALSGLCIAAVQSDKSVATLATEMGIPASSNEVLCNGKPIRNFVTQHRADAASAETVYVISVANQSPETRLCLAALTSQEEFARLKETHFSKVVVEREIACNGMPLSQFVRRYAARVAAVQNAETASL